MTKEINQNNNASQTESVLSADEVLDSSIQYLKGVGPKRAAALKKCGVSTVWDALNYFPYRHEDRRKIIHIRDVENGEFVTVYGLVDTIASRKMRNRKTLVQVSIKDASGIIYGVWFNQKWMKDKFKKGQKVLFSGKAQTSPSLQITNPAVEILPEDFFPEDYEGTLIPIYRLTEEINALAMRKVIQSALERGLPFVEEYLPEKVLKQFSIMPLREAYKIIHSYDYPAEKLTEQNIAIARRRIVIDEFFVIAMGLLMKRRRTEQLPYLIHHKKPGKLVVDFIKSLNFKLTAAQKKVSKEILDDLVKNKPMNRLLQGDVGSGKTIVALIAMLSVVDGGYQAALMAPTEVLARQHFKTISSQLHGTGIKINVLTGSTKAKARREIIESLAAGEPQIIIGTHALIQAKVKIPKLGLAIIDEQHKFGVMQRNQLRGETEQIDVLVMTATPIPRSLALTVYGDLSISTIDELPKGRIPIKTYVIRPERLPRVWEFIRKQVSQGRQAYIVYPLIDESDKLPLKPAVAMYEELKGKILPDLKIGLVHGRVKADEKENVMNAFREGKLDVLVSTTVIEVGIDVPNASVMVIEEANRFGLAQLHQLRGRIGRGGEISYCILVNNEREDQPLREKIKKNNEPVQQDLLETTSNSRLAIMAETNDGFRIAEEDLKIRGPGEFFGIEQTGLPALKLANLIGDEEELRLSRHIADTLYQYRDTLKPETREKIRHRLYRAFGKTIRGVDAG